MTRDSSILARPPSEKEAVSVYLRIKPKTPEESEFYSCTDESGLATIEDDNFEVVTIESTHQVPFKKSLTWSSCGRVELVAFQLAVLCDLT